MKRLTQNERDKKRSTTTCQHLDLLLAKKKTADAEVIEINEDILLTFHYGH